MQSQPPLSGEPTATATASARATLIALALTAFLFVARAFAADDVSDYARKKFEVLRHHPTQLAKLREAARAFAALPRARQTQLEQLDTDLARESSAVQAKLQDTLDRYTEWLSRLPEAERQRIGEAPNAAARLAIVKELRQAEWLRSQPKAIREQIENEPAAARPAAVAKAREEERRRRGEWQVARRFWEDVSKNRPLPSKLADFELQVQSYVNDELMRLLSKNDRDRLANAEGQWPLYPQTLVELADAHPPALPSAEGPSSLAEMPRVVRESLTRKGVGPLKERVLEKKLKSFEGRYPEFAWQLTKLAKDHDWVLPHEWWPYNFKGLSEPMQTFLKKTMEPALDRKQYRLIVEAEGKWPDYPETIQKVAQAHNLRVPWFTLPGNSERWDAYRAGPHPTVPGYPEVPKYKLRDMIAFDLEEFDRIKLKNDIERLRGKADTEAWTHLIGLYFQLYPNELNRLRQIDREKLGLKGP